MSYPPPPGYQPPPGYPTPYPPVLPSTPGPVTAARIIGWIQAGLVIVIGVIMLIAAVAVNSSTNDQNSDISSLGDFTAGVFVILAVVIFALSLTIILPLAYMKRGAKAAPIVLIVFESIYILLDVIGIIATISSSDGGNPIVAVLAMASSAAIIVLLTRPVSRAWSDGTYGAAPAFAGYPQQAQPAYGQVPVYPQQVMPPTGPEQYPPDYQAPGYGTNPYAQQAYQEQPYAEQPYTQPPGQAPYGQNNNPYNQPPG